MGLEKFERSISKIKIEYKVMKGGGDTERDKGITGEIVEGK